MKERLVLAEIPREKKISKKDFLERYVKPQKPVVLEQLIEDWPAYHKWNFNYIREVAGDKTVPLFDGKKTISSEYKFNEPHLHMKMSEYLDLLEKVPAATGYFCIICCGRCLPSRRTLSTRKLDCGS